MTLRRHRPMQPGSGSDEFTIQCAVVQHLMLLAPADVVWMAIPNGEYRSARTGARLKAQGVVAGAPDLLIIANGVPYGLELKADKGRQTESQRAMEAAWNAAGGQYAVAKGLDEALEKLRSWGCLKPSHAVSQTRAA